MYGRCRRCDGASLRGGEYCRKHAPKKKPGPVTYPGPDPLTEVGARALAVRLRQFWSDQGYPDVKFKVVPLPGLHVGASGGDWSSFAVRSDLVNGVPRRTG